MLIKEGKVSASTKKYVDTPLMKQYYSLKSKHPDAVLLFRVGDFYETFGDDAIRTSEILGITLTRRANGAASFVELAGFPHHALETYLPRLVRAGQRVAICEQLEDPKLTKKIVKRGITELVTPGVSYNENVLERKENNFLASVYLQNNRSGIAFLDISTGEFLVAEGNSDYLDKLLSSFHPREVLVEKRKQQLFREKFGNNYFIFPLDDWVYTEENATHRLVNKFQTTNLKGFGIDGMQSGVLAAGAVLQYLENTSHTDLGHISHISRIEEDNHVWLDRFTIRNLEIFSSAWDEGKTLIDVLDRTSTPMGSRLLKRWLALPLKDIPTIDNRLDVVEYFMEEKDVRETIQKKLSGVGDLERIISRVSVRKAGPRDLLQLKNSLFLLEPLKELCLSSGLPALQKPGEEMDPCEAVRERIGKELKEDPSNMINKGNVIAEGVSEELDELRSISKNNKAYLMNLQQEESKRTGIPSLKIAFNNVFGYYIEVRNTHKEKVPPEWIRKQTLVSAERYITQELKDYESKILGAEEKSLQLEISIFNDLLEAVNVYVASIQKNAGILARLDCLLSFALCSVESNYVRPELNYGNDMNIKNGRHPVIEKQLPPGEEYVANDTFLDSKKQQIIILTGPNMSGKSALLRQNALIVLMAQAGCFVPAEKAEIGLVDKIFTRVGASDNLSLGESTFMVEMLETASILNNLSDRSLVLLDEIGRGTSTYDGISIAWAMVEYIHEHPKCKARTLFATHYHELNEMEKSFPRVKNYNIAIREMDDKIIFLRKLIRGGSEHSFGIHVAGMAGMPPSVVKRAEEILKQMESPVQDKRLSKPVGEIAARREGYQTSIFQLDDPVLSQIRDEIASVSIENLTPLEALNKLNEIKKLTGL